MQHFRRLVQRIVLKHNCRYQPLAEFTQLLQRVLNVVDEDYPTLSSKLDML
jgi:hypothetical protein